MNLLKKLNIYGLDEIEDIIFAGLTTGDPILLVGRHGSAKTLLAKRLADCLGLKFIAYDASKALFDDVVGFPDPSSLSRGTVDYIPTPISIWDKEFVLIDEISRATPAMQNKWLEIIRSRRLMGRKIPGLKYVFAAMNPPESYFGAVELDPALSSRFSFIIPVPEVSEMSELAIYSIISNISEDDAVAISSGEIRKSLVIDEDTRRELKNLITQAQERFPEFSQKFDRKITNYIFRLLNFLASRKVILDGRRLGMLRRNFISYLAIKSLKETPEEIEKKFGEYLYFCLNYSLPYRIEGTHLPESTLKLAHLRAIKDEGTVDYLNISNRLSRIDSPRELVGNYIRYYPVLRGFKHSEIIGKLSKIWSEADTPEKIAEVYLAVSKLLKFYQEGADSCPVDVKRKTAELYRQMTAVSSIIRDKDRYGMIYNTESAFSKSKEVKFDYFGDIAFRLYLNCPNRIGGEDMDDIAKELRNYWRKNEIISISTRPVKKIPKSKVVSISRY